MTTRSDYTTFDNAAELRDWLNQFKNTDLATVHFNTPSGFLAFRWDERALTDGSKVLGIRVST